MTSTSFLISVEGRDYIVLPDGSGERMFYRVQIDENVVVFASNESGSIIPISKASMDLFHSIAMGIESYFA
jgi:hypothetical protein